MSIQELTDDELNRAMIWLNPPELGIFNDCERSGIWGDSDGKYTDHLDYLTDWSLTGPLTDKYDIDIYLEDDGRRCAQAGVNFTYVVEAVHESTLRAICECVLMMRMKK